MIDVINSPDLNDETIRKAGYKEYEPSIIDSDMISKCFQKCFSDDIGKRYYIDIKKWDWSNIRADIGVKYEFEVQMCINEKPINFTLFNGWDVEEVEDYINRLWSTGEYDYYEYKRF